MEFGLIILKSQDFDFIGCFPEREDRPDFSIMVKLLNLESIVKANKRLAPSFFILLCQGPGAKARGRAFTHAESEGKLLAKE